MNIYACWHQGRPGYCFEHPRSGWWFVPELGQPDPAVRRHLSFEEFIFASSFDWRLEYRRQQARVATPRWRLCLRALFTPVRPNTVAGLLMLPVEPH